MPSKQTTIFYTKEIVANCTSCSTISLNKWMYPVKPPKPVGSQLGRGQIVPVFMDEGNKTIHEIWDLMEMWWNVSSNVNWLFSKPPTKL